MQQLKIIIPFLIALFIFAGCSAKIEQKKNISNATVQKADWDEIVGFEADDLTFALQVFQKDCKVSKKYDNLKEVCKKTNDINATTNAKDFFMSNFTPYKLLENKKKDTGIITGYYEPLLNGNRYKTKKYKYPVYSIPSDLLTIDIKKAYPKLKDYLLRGKLEGNKIVPYYTRAQIEAIDPTKSIHLKPICYVDDKIDLFFLHIQGSGKIKFPNGKILNIAYAQQNGRKYYAIGKKLIKLGVLTKSEVSLQSIKKWLIENPDKIDEILNLNNSYVFFKHSIKAATGSLGTQLVANRNLAVDRKYIPLGFPVFINTTNPITNKPINQLMIAADTGGAIKGKIRADFFFGNGEEAQELAGKMKQQGKLYIFIPNTQIKEN
ncbi:MAG: peptidoglycan N-acetylmuramoylhydrolase [Epsilonproteobacteria bacterium]|nr:MAG: peptidoglycan N-acetylmuramoylhydrolase [Campylobacterota bacterium]